MCEMRDMMNRIDREWHGMWADIWKAVLIVASVDIWLFDAGIGYDAHSEWWTHLTYVISHANIFHLMGNVLCLLLMKPRMHMPEALLIAVAASFLPMQPEAVTMGMSGVLFAVAGIRWGKTQQLWRMLKYCIPAVAVTALMPNVNWQIHLYCLMAGYGYGHLLGYRSNDLWR